MKTLTISSDYEVVIPKDIREKLNLQPGQKMEAIESHGQITLVPVQTAEELRGFLGDVDIKIEREPERS